MGRTLKCPAHKFGLCPSGPLPTASDLLSQQPAKPADENVGAGVRTAPTSKLWVILRSIPTCLATTHLSKNSSG